MKNRAAVKATVQVKRHVVESTPVLDYKCDDLDDLMRELVKEPTVKGSIVRIVATMPKSRAKEQMSSAQAREWLVKAGAKGAAVYINHSDVRVASTKEESEDVTSLPSARDRMLLFVHLKTHDPPVSPEVVGEVERIMDEEGVG